MSASHTPETWTAFELAGRPHKLFGRGWGVNGSTLDSIGLSERIADCYGPHARNHARLIAAAPELLKALDNVMIGGNHLATVLIRNLGPDFASLWPPYTNPDDVLRKFGSSDNYEGWVCWSKIMQARAALAKAQGDAP